MLLLAICLVAGVAALVYLSLQHRSIDAQLSNVFSALAGNNSVEQSHQSLREALQRNARNLILCSVLLLATVLGIWAIYHRRVYRRQWQSAQAAHLQLIATRERLDEQSRRDALTDTSNRRDITRFLSDIQRSGSHSEEEFVALAFLDIDHFQQINEVLGYFAGDEVLREIARRVHGELRAEDKLGRLEADRFAIVLCGLVAPRTGETIIHRIQQVLEHPIEYKDTSITITTTVGASVQETSSMDISELFKLSDQALMAAKRNHRGSVLLLSDQAQEALSRQRAILNAIKSNQPGDIFNLVYQPIVRLNTDQIAGFECLLRWTSDTPSDMHADEFVPILEMYEDIHTVGEWIMQTSLTQLRDWRDTYPDQSLFMSINVSARQLEAPDFARRTMDILNDLDLNASEVSLELTETMAIKHLESGRKQLALLRNMGLGISLDDFGTGYSSLQYLKTMPATTVKIDQTFIRDMMHDPRDAAIVDSAVHIANAVGLRVVAEGVDNEQQADKLRLAGCDYVQGYYYSAPLRAERIESLLVNNHPGATAPQ
jgi:diguanylate cyclase (GGDEF)-like protein